MQLRHASRTVLPPENSPNFPAGWMGVGVLQNPSQKMHAGARQLVLQKKCVDTRALALAKPPLTWGWIGQHTPGHGVHCSSEVSSFESPYLPRTTQRFCRTPLRFGTISQKVPDAGSSRATHHGGHDFSACFPWNCMDSHDFPDLRAQERRRGPGALHHEEAHAHLRRERPGLVPGRREVPRPVRGENGSPDTSLL